MFFFYFRPKRNFFRTFFSDHLLGAGDGNISGVDTGGRFAIESTVISTIVSSQTVISTISVTGISGITVVSTIKVGGVGFSFSISVTAFTGTGNGNISGVDTWGRFYSSSVGAIRITIVSTIVTSISKTVSIGSQTIAVAIVAIWVICVSIKNSGVSFGFSLSVDSSHKCGDNCNLK